MALRVGLFASVALPLVLGCGGPPATAAQVAALCDVRVSMTAARDQAQRAVNAAINGDTVEADDKAVSAANAAGEAEARLKRLPAELQNGDAGKALTETYNHIRQAASAVRGGPYGDNYSPPTALQEISAAGASLNKAATGACKSA